MVSLESIVAVPDYDPPTTNICHSENVLYQSQAEGRIVTKGYG